jgi:hypothetical protein
MQQIDVCLRRAQPVGTKSAPVVHIAIEKELADIETLQEARATYLTEALRLADGLYASLPGGTLDALLYVLMERKASLFAVAYELPEGKEVGYPQKQE